MEAIDPRSGFDSVTGTFHSLRPPLHLPPESLPLSAAEFALSLLRRRNSQDSVALIDSATGRRVLYSEFARRTQTLAANLRSSLGLSKGDVAFVFSRNVIEIPVLYFALLSIGVIISPANPISTDSEIAALIHLSKPKIAFTVSETARKVRRFVDNVVEIDSSEFESMTMMVTSEDERPSSVKQSDPAAIIYSSGTTGKPKGVVITHRNLIAVVAGLGECSGGGPPAAVVLYTVPYFHVYGFLYNVKSVGAGETAVVMERFEMRKMLRAVEEFRVTKTAFVPPIVVAVAKGSFTAEYDLTSLESVDCGGAPLGKEAVAAFMAKFPNVALLQGYGLTESTGVSFRMVNREESLRLGSAGRLIQSFEAKIVDPHTQRPLPPCTQGELWIRGPSIMKGYIGDKESTSTSLVEGGWLRTGDLCYIDHQGFLFVLDRLKELIKFKAYQVAPAELEQLLHSHPDILDAALIPYPDEEAGEVPMAIVVRRPKSNLGESQVINFVAQQVSPYKKIRRVAFVESIPKTASGKILRRVLRKTFTPSATNFSRL